MSGAFQGVPQERTGLRVSHEAITAAWSGWEGMGFGKETRLYLQRRFLTHSPDGPGFRI